MIVLLLVKLYERIYKYCFMRTVEVRGFQESLKKTYYTFISIPSIKREVEVDPMKFVVRLSGRNAVEMILGFKGSVQSIIRRSGKYPNARLNAHKKERTIEIAGVDGRFLKETFEKVKFSKTGFKRLDYEIEKVEETPVEVTPEKYAEERYKHWVESTQKEWKKKEKRFRIQIVELSDDKKAAEEEKETLAGLLKEEQKRYKDLHKSLEKITKKIDKLERDKVKDLTIACHGWVGSWMVDALKLESSILDSMGDISHETLAGLAITERNALIKEACKELKLKPASMKTLQSLADETPWRKTKEYQRLKSNYDIAIEEKEYVNSIKTGKTKVPQTVIDVVLKEIDEDRNTKTIEEFETKKEKFQARSKRRGKAASFLQEIELVSRVDGLMSELSDLKNLPIALTCLPMDEEWVCRVMIPHGNEGGFVETAINQIVARTLKRHCHTDPEMHREDSVCIYAATVPGKYKSFKEVSRLQERVFVSLGEEMFESVFTPLGVPWKIAKVMEDRFEFEES